MHSAGTASEKPIHRDLVNSQKSLGPRGDLFARIEFRATVAIPPPPSPIADRVDVFALEIEPRDSQKFKRSRIGDFSRITNQNASDSYLNFATYKFSTCTNREKICQFFVSSIYFIFVFARSGRSAHAALSRNARFISGIPRKLREYRKTEKWVATLKRGTLLFMNRDFAMEPSRAIFSPSEFAPLQCISSLLDVSIFRKWAPLPACRTTRTGVPFDVKSELTGRTREGGGGSCRITKEEVSRVNQSVL